MDFDDLESRLPTAMASFAELRKDGSVYVDKTAFVQKIAGSRKPKILTRPRRFGKSTLQSTIKELFLHGLKPYDGHDSYFKGLAIEKLWHDDGLYLVLHLDFYNLSSGRTVTLFSDELMKAIASFCRANELAEPDQSSDFGACFNSMLEQLAFNSLVLLIDEFDAPLLRHYNQEQELARCKDLMDQLFSAVKTQADKCRCVFFTGITRFQDLGLGTAGNNFTDISYDEEFATCCGYTHDELKQYFAQHLRYAAALSNGCAMEAVSDAQVVSLLKDMSEWYDGYSFDGTEQHEVFSTWSVLRFFANAKATLRPYWVTEEGSGVPQLLKISLDRIELEPLMAKISKGEVLVGGQEFLKSSLINPNANPYSLLFQAGYLTFKDPYDASDNVHLTCPNQEIIWGFTNLLVRHFFNLEVDLCTNTSSRKALAALSSLDAEQIRAFFNYAIEFLPYTHNPDNEFWAADLIILLLFGLGYKPRVEVMSLHGRADCVFDVPWLHTTIVLEFKFESSPDPKQLDAKLAEALQQIKDRKYALNGTSEPRVARFGLVYCSDPSERKFVRMALADQIEL